jgi:hypothetical protein
MLGFIAFTSTYAGYGGSFTDRFRQIEKIERLGDPAIPLPIVNALFHPAVESGIRPVARAIHQTVFDRLIVEVIEMPPKVPFIPPRMLPESPLPYPAPTVA